MSIKDIRVKSIERRNIVGYAELTIEAACLEPSPNLEATKVRIESANEMEVLLRAAAYETQPNGICGDIHCTGTFREDLLALLARIDAASLPRQPR